MKTMRQITAMVLTLIMLTLSVTTVTADASTVQVTVTGTQYYDGAFEVLTLVNQQRAAQGLSPLSMDQSLLESAMLRAGEIGLYFDHTRPDGTACFTVNPKAFGENIAMGQSTPAAVMESWMNSEGHRANILNSRWNSIGIGYMVVNNMPCWVQLFGEAKATTAAQSANRDATLSIKASPDLLQLELGNTPSSMSMNAGESQPVSLIWRNAGWGYQTIKADPSDLTYTSSDPDVVAPDGKGNLQAIGGGQATVTISLNGAASVSTGLTVTVSGSAAKPLPGDVDQNRKVEAADALLALQAATDKISLNTAQQTSANVDGDNTITANDALMILQAATGKIALG